MVTAPVIDDLDDSPAHDHRAGRLDHVDELAGRAGGPADCRRDRTPVVQPVAVVTAEASWGSAMYPSSDMDMKSTEAGMSTPVRMSRPPSIDHRLRVGHQRRDVARFGHDE